MRTTQLLCCLALAFALVACSDDASQSNNGGWNINNGTDAGADAEADTAADTANDTGEPDIGLDTGEDSGWSYDGGTANNEVVFELKNESGRPIYAHQQVAGMPCAYGDSHWLSVNQSDGSNARLADDCSICNCDEAEDCAVCAYDCPGPPTREWTELGDDESRSYRWDGRIWQTNAEGCEAPHLAVDQTLEAEFCWGTGFDDTSSAMTGYRCTTVDFELTGAYQVVEVVVPERDTHDITFRMINDTGKDLYANPDGAARSFRCYGSWYSVGDGDEAYTLAPSCGICDCGVVEQNPGEQCSEPCPAVACAAPNEEAFRFPDGAELVDTWSGTIVEHDEVAGQTCERQTLPPLDELVATFCFAEEVEDYGSHTSLGPTTCEQISFDRLADDEVVLRLQ